MKNPATIIISLILLLLAIIFAVQNSGAVDITIYFWEVSISLAIILFSTLFIGIIIGIFLLIPTILKLRRRVARLSRIKRI